MLCLQSYSSFNRAKWTELGVGTEWQCYIRGKGRSLPHMSAKDQELPSNFRLGVLLTNAASRDPRPNSLSTI
jgi:hypothetical protein